ncbi:MAG: polysulfide reductase NrfD, partial [Chloroflexota bacterium]|nr:polysulfide reductase NrfD [Chloroflexota bacterium]
GLAAPLHDRLRWESFLLWANLVLAAALVSYTGVLLGQTSRPLWSGTWFIPALFAVSALSTGVAALALLARWRGRAAVPEVVARLERADGALLLMELAVLAIFLAWLSWLSTPPAARSASVLLSGSFAWWFWGGVVVVGLLAPLVLAKARRALGSLAAWAGPALVLAGGLALRYVIVAAGQVGPLA